MKLSRLFLLLVVAWTGMASSCKKPDPPTHGNLIVKIDPVISGHEYAFNTWDKSSDGQDFLFERLDFYLTEVELVKADNSVVPINEALLFRLNPEDQHPGNYIGTAYLFPNLPLGDYKGIRFGIGVSPDIASVSNGTYDLSKYAAEHALSEYQGMTWGMAGYKHAFLEGKTKAGGADQKFSYHVALDTFYTPVEVMHDLSLEDIQNTVVLKLDIDKIFNPADAGSKIVLSEDLTTHSSKGSPDEMDLASRVVQNLSKAISFE